ncbi:unnamed protein product [Rhizoctonia solani]|uniref:RRM domain-containing protein n=1 Tax=Rhizoctonia solani TaxID=456999 RepID=A0A8H2XK04_9AGAM|nr:unnamed protein product [Rhizoctonia solani]
MTDAWPAPSDAAPPAADGWNGTRADRSPLPHADRERQRDRSRSPGRKGDDRGRSNAGHGGVGANPGNNIHVSGLSSRVDNRMLDEAFGKYGKVAKASVVYDPHSRESRGFAFVTMDSVEEAEAAIAGLHNSELAGKPITVEKARRGRAPREEVIVRIDMALNAHTIQGNTTLGMLPATVMNAERRKNAIVRRTTTTAIVEGDSMGRAGGTKKIGDASMVVVADATTEETVVDMRTVDK